MNILKAIKRLCFCLFLLGAGPAWADEVTLSKIADLIATPRSEAANKPVIKVRGVVSLVGEGLASAPKTQPSLSSFCLESQGIGIWVGVSQARREGVWQGKKKDLLALKEGTEIELDGQLDEGAFAPIIVPQNLRLLGEQVLPPAQEVSLAKLMSGAADVQRVVVSGVVQSIAEESDSRWLLKVQTGLGHFLARLPRTEAFAPALLLDAEVRMTGLAAVSRNWRSEFVCPRLILSKESDVNIVKPAPADPFSAQKVALNALDGYTPEGRPRHRRRIEGTVTCYAAGQYVYIQDGLYAVRVDPAPAEPLALGDRVEAAGFIDTSRNVAGLTGSEFRVLAKGTVPDPLPVRMEQIAEDFNEMKVGRPGRLPGCDGLLVAVTGKLLSHQISAEGMNRLELDCGDSISTAFIGGILPDLLTASELRMTGVALLQYAPAGQTANFAQPIRLDLILRDPDDIVVLHTPSWWTLQRTYAALGGVLVLALAVLGWAVTLRRNVARQTHLLAQEMRGRRNAAVEFQAALRERLRLAANLHDTVLQTITGISYQIEACESESIPVEQRRANHLETARRMVQRGQEDLRNAVWALRALPLKERNFTEAVRSVARQVSAGHQVEILVQHEGELPLLADFIAGNLLLIAQEAIHNAIKHAHSKQIRVTLAALEHDSRLALTVEDDGAGFTLGTQPGTKDGHFGLEGMRERAERLNGTLQVSSQPSKGTVIHVEVPLHPFDHELA